MGYRGPASGIAWRVLIAADKPAPAPSLGSCSGLAIVGICCLALAALSTTGACTIEVLFRRKLMAHSNTDHRPRHPQKGATNQRHNDATAAHSANREFPVRTREDAIDFRACRRIKHDASLSVAVQQAESKRYGPLANPRTAAFFT
jgi:hypothetical protein